MQDEIRTHESQHDLMREYIKYFFDDFEDKVAFVRQLFDDASEDRKDEAMILCLVYIDGLGNAVWPQDPSSQNFVRILRQCGGQTHLDLVHTEGLVQRLREDERSKYRDLGDKICDVLKPKVGALCTERELTEHLSQHLTPAEMQLASKMVWKGTVAYVAYERLRNQWIHNLMRHYSGVSVGDEIPAVDFDALHAALVTTVRHARRISEDSGKFFGHGRV